MFNAGSGSFNKKKIEDCDNSLFNGAPQAELCQALDDSPSVAKRLIRQFSQ
jgi:hypothetical protein